MLPILLLLSFAPTVPEALPTPLPPGWVQLDTHRVLVPVTGPYGDPIEMLRLTRRRRSVDCDPSNGGPFESHTHTTRMPLQFDIKGLIDPETVRTAHLRIYRLPITTLSPKHASELLGLTLFEVVSGEEMRHVETKNVRPQKLQEGKWRTIAMTGVLMRWLRRPSSNRGLELWTRNVEPKVAAKWLARHFRFAPPTHEEVAKRPMLLIHFR